MKKIEFLTFVFLVFLVFLAAGAAGAVDNAVSVGVGQGTVAPAERSNPCPGSTFLQNDDGSFENGFSWQYAGVVPPFYGAFVEGHDLPSACGIQVMLTSLGGQYQGAGADWYVFDSDGLYPTNIASITPNLAPGQPAVWPNISAHDINVVEGITSGPCFAGFWGCWPGQRAQWFLAADLDGSGGRPRTNIAPGIGYPTGWQDPSVVWGPTQALGIRVYTHGIGGISDVPFPDRSSTRETTWSAIKLLHR